MIRCDEHSQKGNGFQSHSFMRWELVMLLLQSCKVNVWSRAALFIYESTNTHFKHTGSQTDIGISMTIYCDSKSRAMEAAWAPPSSCSRRRTWTQWASMHISAPALVWGDVHQCAIHYPQDIALLLPTVFHRWWMLFPEV